MGIQKNRLTGTCQMEGREGGKGAIYSVQLVLELPLFPECKGPFTNGHYRMFHLAA